MFPNSVSLQPFDTFLGGLQTIASTILQGVMDAQCFDNGVFYAAVSLLSSKGRCDGDLMGPCAFSKTARVQAIIRRAKDFMQGNTSGVAAQLVGDLSERAIPRG